MEKKEFFLSLILTAVIVALCLMIVYTVKKEIEENEKREKLCMLGIQLVEIQLSLLSAYGFKEGDFEIEVAEDLKESFFPAILYGSGKEEYKPSKKNDGRKGNYTISSGAVDRDKRGADITFAAREKGGPQN